MLLVRAVDLFTCSLLFFFIFSVIQPTLTEHSTLIVLSGCGELFISIKEQGAILQGNQSLVEKTNTHHIINKRW